MSGELRMRVFAGPNGSGKSTIIKSVRDYTINNAPIDFGIYINADDIARELRNDTFAFDKYETTTRLDELQELALASGLIGNEFTPESFINSFKLDGNKLQLIDPAADERIAQILADFLRKKLLIEKRKFSFETVFSHPSKLDIMREAKDAGYKVYLYFVSTESPEFNKDRVKIRVKEQGHNVPTDKIESRYYRSLEQLYDAAQLAYQAYFFDNTGIKPLLFGHFKQIGGEKNWDDFNPEIVPRWFNKYYSQKVSK